MPTENKPAEPFQREDRYIVIKRSDMEKAPADLHRSFSRECRNLHEAMLTNGAPARSFVVVEQDWPEYHLVWAMLEHRMAGKPVPDFNLWRRADELQQHLNAADERIDELTGLLRRCLMSVREQHCDQDEADFDLPTDLMADIDAQLPASTETEQDDDWRMNPCKQGHRDVGAAGGIAHCYQCDEKIEASTTQEAFERWNATHPQQ